MPPLRDTSERILHLSDDQRTWKSLKIHTWLLSSIAHLKLRNMPAVRHITRQFIHGFICVFDGHSPETDLGWTRKLYAPPHTFQSRMWQCRWLIGGGKVKHRKNDLLFNA